MPEAAEIQALIEDDRLRRARASAAVSGNPNAFRGEAPICAVFIQSRAEYEAIERRVREELANQQAVAAHVLPIPPLWAIANRHQISALIELRRRSAARFDALLLLLTERPEFLAEDLLEYLHAEAAWLPAAIVDAWPNGLPQGVGVGLPTFRLDAPDFGSAMGAWLRDCTTLRRRRTTEVGGEIGAAPPAVTAAP
jgi:hypothetical protein